MLTHPGPYVEKISYLIRLKLDFNFLSNSKKRKLSSSPSVFFNLLTQLFSFVCPFHWLLVCHISFWIIYLISSHCGLAQCLKYTRHTINICLWKEGRKEWRNIIWWLKMWNEMWNLEVKWFSDNTCIVSW